MLFVSRCGKDSRTACVGLIARRLSVRHLDNDRPSCGTFGRLNRAPINPVLPPPLPALAVPPCFVRRWGRRDVRGGGRRAVRHFFLSAPRLPDRFRVFWRTKDELIRPGLGRLSQLITFVGRFKPVCPPARRRANELWVASVRKRAPIAALYGGPVSRWSARVHSAASPNVGRR